MSLSNVIKKTLAHASSVHSLPQSFQWVDLTTKILKNGAIIDVNLCFVPSVQWFKTYPTVINVITHIHKETIQTYQIVQQYIRDEHQSCTYTWLEHVSMIICLNYRCRYDNITIKLPYIISISIDTRESNTIHNIQELKW